MPAGTALLQNGPRLFRLLLLLCGAWPPAWAVPWSSWGRRASCSSACSSSPWAMYWEMSTARLPPHLPVSHCPRTGGRGPGSPPSTPAPVPGRSPPLPEHQCPVQYLGRCIGQQVAVWVLLQLVPARRKAASQPSCWAFPPAHWQMSDLLLCQFLLKGEQGCSGPPQADGQRGQQGDIRIGVVPLPLAMTAGADTPSRWASCSWVSPSAMRRCRRIS